MATRDDSCIKRDVCTFYGCGSTSDLCADCGHYLAEAVNTSTNKQMVAALWDAICSDSVKKVGYDASESEWVPLNIERLNAAWKKVNESSAHHH